MARRPELKTISSHLPAGRTSIVETRQVNYSVDGRQILHDLNFYLRDQETLAILGSSGTGKSTLLKLILGLYRPDSGEVLIEGRDINALSYEELVEVRKKLGIVFQEGALFDSLTIGENVGYYLMEHREVEPLVLEMLETVGLGHTIDMTPDQLSGGMRRRVAIARALIYNPSLILYDEPTNGLDPVATDNILRLINQLKHHRKVASVIVTHDFNDAARVADHFVIIQHGRIAWRGSRHDFLANRKRMLCEFFQTPGMPSSLCEEYQREKQS
jgi:phospholipid/cholesterol/gamma-HCH transport system ATP-binding protein